MIAKNLLLHVKFNCHHVFNSDKKRNKKKSFAALKSVF